MRFISFLYRNSLSLVLVILFLLSISGQIFTGWKQHNSELQEHGAGETSLSEYLGSGHFLQATFENWESEFLQMGMYVLLTVFLRQRGSSESKSLEEKEEVDREPDPKRKDAPWPVKRGGFILKIYKNSLSIAFILLFVISWLLHFKGSLTVYNEEQRLKNEPESSVTEYLSNSKFWFESFQNWQSEFVAVISIVMLSIFLRQYGSPESKPVDAPNSETGE
jgi:hypothetical protein